jgi:hypothetical protein
VNITDTPEFADTVEAAAADPKISAKEEFAKITHSFQMKYPGKSMKYFWQVWQILFGP